MTATPVLGDKQLPLATLVSIISMWALFRATYLCSLNFQAPPASTFQYLCQ